MDASLRNSVQSAFLHLGRAVGLDEHDVQEIEVGVYNWAIRFSKQRNVTRNWADPIFRRVYLEKARHLFVNMDAGSYVQNNRLAERLRNSEFAPVTLATMEPERIFPEKWKDHVQALALKEEKELKPKIIPKTDRFKCRMCKKNECSYYEMQLRSGDEASTILLLCLNCGNRWRING